MPDGMFMPPIPRGVINRRRRRTTAKRTIIADIGPDMPSDRFALGQDRHRRVVAVQPFRSQNWITFHCRGITSSVSVMSSPSFDSLADPQHGQLSGAAITTRSRGR
jgi:hypothetical protein